MFDIPVIGWLLSKSHQIPVIPGRTLEAFRKACEVLRQGYTVMIFPEGRLNPDQILSSSPTSPAGRVCSSAGAHIAPGGSLHSLESSAREQH